MSNMQGNPHYESADRGETRLGDTLASEGITDATIVAEAQLVNTQATLALAYEQRTENLIKMLKWLCGEGASGMLELEAQIKARLGLNGDQP